MFKLRAILKLTVTKSLRCLKPIQRAIVYSSFPDIPSKQESLAEYIFSCCDKYSNKIAFVDDYRKINYSYSDVKQIIQNMASALVKAGVQTGTMVAIIALNSPEYLMLLSAMSSMGCSVTLYNPNYTQNELKYHLSDSKPSIIFTDEKNIERVAQMVSQSQIKSIYLIGNRKPGYLAVDDLMSDSGNMNPIGQIKLDFENQIALLPYSSGTTGLPKGVMLTHKNLVSNCHQVKFAHETNNNVQLLVLPLYHIYGTNVASIMGINSGSTTIVQPKFDPLLFLNAIEKYKVSKLHLVPPQILFLLNNPNVSKYDLSSVERVFSAAASLDAQIESLLNDKFQKYQKDFEVFQGYGLTELSPAAHIKPYDTRFQRMKLGSIGKLLSNMQCKIVDVSTREELPANNDGEMLLKGPNVMKGYFGKVDETEQCFENDWFKTGDIGRYDDDHYFYITGRIKELLKVKGLQVAPTELEAMLLTINGIEDCAVVGVPHERYGEVPRAFIVKNGEIDENQINDFMQKNLSEHKQLKGGIIFVSEIPKTSSGKILRRLLESK